MRWERTKGRVLSRVVEGASLSYTPPPPREERQWGELCTCSGEDLKGFSLFFSSLLSLSLAGRRFSVQRCARCHLGISASEMVMRARDSVYHLNCFTCSTCAKMLTTGDHFGMKDGLVYCRLHFEALLRDEYQLHFNHAEGVAGKGPALGAAAPLGLPYYNGVGTVQKGRPRKRKSPGPGAELAAYNAGKGRARQRGGGGGGNGRCALPVLQKDRSARLRRAWFGEEGAVARLGHPRVSTWRFRESERRCFFLGGGTGRTRAPPRPPVPGP